MRVFIYKRTHPGDPREEGIFGIEDCMGCKREYDFDAVIGIGGRTCTRAAFKGIRLKINWAGTDPKALTLNGRHCRANALVFKRFKLYEEHGALIEKEYPYLFKYMYITHNRARSKMIDTSDAETYGQALIDEINSILADIGNMPSPSYDLKEVSVKVSCPKKGGCGVC